MSVRSPFPAPSIPPYGYGTLAEIVPSGLALLLDNWPDPLGLRERVEHVRRVCLYLIDGLGATAIRDYGDTAPTLRELLQAENSSVIRTCFPSTTVTSLASIGTGLTPGRHGLVGYTINWQATGEIINLVRFSRYGASPNKTITDALFPQKIQPHPTLFTQATEAGIPVISCTNTLYEGSGLTQATLRGTLPHGWTQPEEAPTQAAKAAAEHDRCFIYAYHPSLDRIGHVSGVGSDPWLEELARVDNHVQNMRAQLPSDTLLMVTGDHGMMNIDEEKKIDFDTTEALQEGVRALGGEPRMRHVYTLKNAGDFVLETWRDFLADQAWVVSKQEALQKGWFGPVVESRVLPSIGNVVAAFTDAPSGIFQTKVDNLQSRLRGHHGSFSEAESHIPLLISR